MGRTRYPRRSVALAVLFGLTSCSIDRGVDRDKPDTDSQGIRIAVDQGANLDRPVALDLVVVFDKGLKVRLQAMSARAWFLAREQIGHDAPKSFRAWRWEVVPGQIRSPLSLGDDARPILGAFVFADFATPGEHRIQLETLSNIILHIKARDFSIEKYTD